ncbi:MAG: cation transporter, partial [Bdellovibrionaceae bacterium]|nr:cation transporter [Pseudobdellovibrionaceae bacterium]
AFAIGLAFFLERLSRKAADDRYSYGYRRFSAAAALVTGFILVAGSVYILSEAIPRFFDPQTPHAQGMIAMAFLGVAVNGFAAWKVSRGVSLNEKMIVWHLLEDVLGWVAVLIGAVIIQVTGWAQVDALLACLLACWILYNVVRNLKEVIGVFLQMVPPGIDLPEIERKVRALVGVKDIHHVHVWSIDGEKHVLTAHIVAGTETATESLKAQIKGILKQAGIVEATLEFEPPDAHCEDPHHH